MRVTPSAAELTAFASAVLSGLLIAFCAIVIVVGSSYQPSEGWLAVVLADELALLWITLGSTAHVVFVPAFCVTVALRDRRRERVGIEVPEPSSGWVGHERVFGDEAGAKRQPAAFS